MLISGTVYKLETELGIYIGSTTRDLHIRLQEHKCDSKYTKKNTSAQIIRNAVNISIEPLEVLNNVSKYELLEAEKRYMQMYPTHINRYLPCSGKQYARDTCIYCGRTMLKASIKRHVMRNHQLL